MVALGPIHAAPIQIACIVMKLIAMHAIIPVSYTHLCLQLVEFVHRIGLDVIGNVYVWFHRLVVAVSRPLHHHLCGNTQCQSVADECPSSGMGSQQGVFGCDGVYTFISLVVSFPYRVVDFRKFPQFFQIIVHLLVADDRKCLVIFKVYALSLIHICNIQKDTGEKKK